MTAPSHHRSRTGTPRTLTPHGNAAGNPPPRSGQPSATLDRLLSQAARCVMAVRQGRSLNDALAEVPAELRPGTQALAFHSLRWLAGADAARAALVPRRPEPAIEGLLLVALALLWPQAEPLYDSFTVVDQAVNAARRENEHATRFINGVLRRFLRERDALVDHLQAVDPLLVHQHPRWWIERLRQDWPQHWAALLAAANRHPPMVLRVNTRQGDVDAYLAELQAASIAAHRLTDAGQAISTSSGQAVEPPAAALVLDTPVPVASLPGFATGRVSVQDAHAQLAAPLLVGRGADALSPGARVLDACAAPGGKTAHLLELADLDVTALDSDAARLDLARATLARLGLHARLTCADAGDTAAWWDGRPFDAILLDAPCSASGIVRRHPDIRWLRRPGDIDALATTQARLLDALWPLLAPGGRLVYATCSVFAREGKHQIEAFLQRTTTAILRDAPGQLLPLADNGPAPGDGFYYARLDKAVTAGGPT